MKKIIVVDGQGGNIGKQIVKSIKESFPGEYVRAVGTNSVATANIAVKTNFFVLLFIMLPSLVISPLISTSHIQACFS